MPLSYLAELSRQPLPLRVTEPARVRLVRRLQATRQVTASFHTGDDGEAWANVLEITPLGHKILKCASARQGTVRPAPVALPALPEQTSD